MSYDLYLLPSTASTPPTPSQFGDWFRSRDYYDVFDREATYESEETGVHFMWDFAEINDATDEDPNDPTSKSVLMLTLNFMRPSFFAHEAALEIEAVQKKFGLTIYDPQKDAEWEAPFNCAAFAEYYCGPAKWATNAISQQADDFPAPHALPKATLDRIWNWNYNRNHFQEQLGEDLFVPKILAVLYEGQVLTTVVWGDGVPMCLPKVDVILAARSETAPKAGLFRRQTEILELIPYAEFSNVFGAFFSPDERSKNAISCSPEDGQGLQAILRERPAGISCPLDGKQNNPPFHAMVISSVLDAEFFEEN